tara:strand:+ start:7581 stop:8225 length:645 start_codon:yes stop_codon:yes gene_type:complete
MRKVISFGLWGDHPDYMVGAIKNIELASEVYPGWEVWFSIEESIPADVIKEVSERADNVIIYSDASGWEGLFKRFLPMCDPSVDVFISRDCDSRLSDREFQAVQSWLSSDKQFHCMRDHEAHKYPPVLGGMWGAKRFGLINTDFLFHTILSYNKKSYFDDQKGLATFYKSFSPLFLEHDDRGEFNGQDFPYHKPMKYGTFIGQRITADDKEGRV